MTKILIVGLGGFMGSVSRYQLSLLVHKHFNGRFPLGTFLVNVIGCFLIGSLMSLVEERELFTPNTRLFLLVGLLGSFTTFSTLGYDTIALIKEGELRLALLYATGNFAVGMAAVTLGWITVKAVTV